MNKLIIIGNLTNDPEMRTTTSGKNVCTFTVAVNRRNEGADFFRVSAWDKRGEVCGKYLEKGKKVCVTGSVSTHAYRAKNGDPAASLEVFAEEVEFISQAGKTGENEAKKDSQTGFDQVETDELPF